MFVEAIEELERAAAAVTVFDDGDSIARVLGVVDVLLAKAVPAIGSFDEWGCWQADDAASLPGWLSYRCGLSAAEANRLAVRAKRLRQLPLTRDAWVGGVLRGGHVDAVVANTSARNVALFAEHEAELVPALARLGVHDARTVMQRWAVAAEAVLDETAPADTEQSLSASRTYGDRLEVKASLVGNTANVVEAALRLADSGDLSVGAAERRAEALGVIAEHYLDHQTEAVGGRHRPHVNIVIDVDRLSDHGDARTLDGFPVAPATAAQLCCDAAVHRVVMAGSSTILEYCRATRLVSASLFAALVLRDGGCRYPGCGRAARSTHAHHIWAWEDGGPTNLDNLVQSETDLFYQAHERARVVMSEKGHGLEARRWRDATIRWAM